MAMLHCLLFGVSATITVLLIAWLARHATSLRLVDVPGGHKHHQQPTPVVGGIGIALSLLIVLIAQVLSGKSLATQSIVALGTALAMLLLGCWDDRRNLSPRTRFIGQSMAALVLASFGGALLIDLGTLMDGEHVLVLGWFSWPMTVFSIVGVMNACNMSDGMDGSAGSLALLAIAGVLVLAGERGDAALPLSALLGTLIGFLFWNLPLLRPARVYLGDGGSLFLGALLAWLLVSMSQGETRAFSPAAALWLYALPLIDTVSVMWRRLADGHSPFQADQRHVHHVLLRAGWTVRSAWLILSGAAALGVSVAVVATMRAWSDPWLAIGFLALAFCHHALMRRADRDGRYLGRQLAINVAAATLATKANPIR